MISVKVVKPLPGHDIGAIVEMTGRVARPLLDEGIVERMFDDAAPAKKPAKAKK